MIETHEALLWIDGREVPPLSGETFPVLDPGRGETIGDAARGTQEDVDRAVEAAGKAFRSSAWHDMDPFQRGRLLWAWARKVEAELDVSHVTVNGGGGFGIDAPFGGVKQSGFGREGGYESILQYSRVKNVWINL